MTEVFKNLIQSRFNSFHFVRLVTWTL